ncbi:MAG: hypothetical protein RMN52_06220 [Anaerolineae bacterium]|nr:hypothetical protein [Candidatus Roseilinea sp.]MDW8449582.1 hypothetical protein [Anaerolineae bacterium]
MLPEPLDLTMPTPGANQVESVLSNVRPDMPATEIFILTVQSTRSAWNSPAGTLTVSIISCFAGSLQLVARFDDHITGALLTRIDDLLRPRLSRLRVGRIGDAFVRFDGEIELHTGSSN